MPKFTEPVVQRYASESGRWYNVNGQCVESVPSADGRKLINPSLRNAARCVLVPSVTTVLQIINKPGVNKAYAKLLLDAADTLPVIENELAEKRRERVIEDADRVWAMARASGTEIHAAISRYLVEGTLPETEAACAAVAWIDNWHRQLGATDIKSEVSSVVPGQYGFTTDNKFSVGPVQFFVDFKTMDDDKLDGYEPYTENGLQLAGNGAGWGGVPSDRYFNIGIGRKTGRCVPYEWAYTQERPEGPLGMVENFQAWTTLLRYWQLVNGWKMRTAAALADVPAAQQHDSAAMEAATT